MRVLYVTTIGITMRFFETFIKSLLDEGNIIDIATNESEKKVPSCYREWGCRIFPIDTSRSPLDKGNFMAIKQIKKIVEENKYDIVHCHTPIAAMCTRIACRKVRTTGTKVLYTAHGFHFYKGSPMRNWLLYYPVEQLCAKFTDVLITINQEDYSLAFKKLKAKRIVYVPGVGIDTGKYRKSAIDRREKRLEIGIPDDAILLLSVGELNENKNHETVIRTIVDINNIYYVIAGEGPLHNQLQNLVNDLGITERVKLLGYRNDIGELCEIADIYVMPSFREGLSVALMEAMSTGLPCVVSRIRGNVDLIDENGGALFDPHNINECKMVLTNMIASDTKKFGEYNRKKIEKFSLSAVNSVMEKIYEEETNG